MISGFASEGSLKYFAESVKDGLWISEELIFEKYFKNKNAKLLDLGCGAGRTTIPLKLMGFDVTGIDIVDGMIENARKIAEERNLLIDYQTADAEELNYPNESFTYALFSNQGLVQIPGEDSRQRVMKETHRILTDGGIFIFSAINRIWNQAYFYLWLKQWFRFYLIKPLGFRIPELEFGDYFFCRESGDRNKTYETMQYIHFPNKKKLKKDLVSSGFKVLEVYENLQPSEKSSSTNPPAIYVCRKV